MSKFTWFTVVGLAFTASNLVISFAPVYGAKKESEVQVCEENSVRLPAPPGHVACALKNGKVINLRSTK